MDQIYEALFSSEHLFSEQVAHWMFRELSSEGPVLAVIGADRQIWSRDEKQMQALFPDQDVLLSVCDRIDDGQDPVLCSLNNICVLGTEIYTERANAGYVLVILPNSTVQSAQENLDFIELFFDQVRLICTLIEKNNQLHQLHLNHLSRNSPILSNRSS